ncbi:MAG: hypothetical protein U0998_05120 [Moraxellaceae bacterium]|nr:hypothetical protein [Moraxellaceae bacterium]MDZ4386588.1 hypothetical protein [Moraxellaceae bacterium]
MLNQNEYNGFAELKKELCKKTKKPLLHPAYYVYLIMGVLMFGGSGVWFELITFMNGEGLSEKSLKTALATYSLAIVGASGVQIALDDDFSKGFRGISLLAIMLLIIFSYAGYSIGGLGFLILVICVIFSIWVWWVANSSNASLLDRAPSNAATGGDPTKQLAGSIDNKIKI